MLTTLNTAYTDTRAADLAWALGREPLPALATLDLELTGAKLQLRLLGASHQVLPEEEQGSHCSETVACIPGSSTPLPLGVAKRAGDWEYEFAARVEVLSPGSFAGRARGLHGPRLRPPPRSGGRLPRQSLRLHGDARAAPRGAGALAYVARVSPGRPTGGHKNEGGGQSVGDAVSDGCDGCDGCDGSDGSDGSDGVGGTDWSRGSPRTRTHQRTRTPELLGTRRSVADHPCG